MKSSPPPCQQTQIFCFIFFTRDWKTQIHRVHDRKLKQSGHDNAFTGTEFLSEFQHFDIRSHSISHKQLKKKNCIPACAVNHPTKVEVAQYLFQILPCAQKGPVSMSCLLDSATHTVPAFQKRVVRNKHTSKMCAAAPFLSRSKIGGSSWCSDQEWKKNFPHDVGCDGQVGFGIRSSIMWIIVALYKLGSCAKYSGAANWFWISKSDAKNMVRGTILFFCRTRYSGQIRWPYL